MSKDCVEPRAEKLCYKCNQAGHLSRDCSQNSSYNDGPTCYNCNQAGHMSRDCPESNGNSRSFGGALLVALAPSATTVETLAICLETVTNLLKPRLVTSANNPDTLPAIAMPKTKLVFFFHVLNSRILLN
ncbi:hypothetical protein BY458DRAFT_59724 [Sporodiniella umbellata]|nr:hypothetical protein BY458DRAFT_59724 [Sporodiniella umbellata]